MKYTLANTMSGESKSSQDAWYNSCFVLRKSNTKRPNLSTMHKEKIQEGMHISNEGS